MRDAAASPGPSPRAPDAAEDAMVLIVCSSGGHLAQMHQLEPWWLRYRRLWVTFDTADSVSMLDGERTIWCHRPTTRNIPNLIRNTWLAWKVLRSNPISLVVSNGAAVAFPFFLFARLLRIPSVYVEVYERFDSFPTLTGRLCYPLATRFLLQWPEQKQLYPRGELIGPLL